MAQIWCVDKMHARLAVKNINVKIFSIFGMILNMDIIHLSSI